MRLTPDAIQQAFQAHARFYANQRDWNVGYHVGCWSRAHRAFETNAATELEWLYEEVGRRWQAFRPYHFACWSAERTFAQLNELDDRYQAMMLSQLEDSDLEGCWQVLQTMSGIKATGTPSVVAISKFLHFWNPRLFVIVDDGVMWQRVFSRAWLWLPIARERRRVERLLSDPSCPKNDSSCDLLSYLAVLSWSASLVRSNSEVTPLFTEYVRAAAHDDLIDFPIEAYEAAAVEWLLLGLAELPPPGVALD